MRWMSMGYADLESDAFTKQPSTNDQQNKTTPRIPETGAVEYLEAVLNRARSACDILVAGVPPPDGLDRLGDEAGKQGKEAQRAGGNSDACEDDRLRRPSFRVQQQFCQRRLTADNRCRARTKPQTMTVPKTLQCESPISATSAVGVPEIRPALGHEPHDRVEPHHTSSLSKQARTPPALARGRRSTGVGDARGNGRTCGCGDTVVRRVRE